jgi:hypothetical protein
MEQKDAVHFLQAMTDYFEAGNQQTDAVAKDIIESDFEYLERWQAEIKRLKAAGQWTGLRAPEAEVIVEALRILQEMLDVPSG